MFGAPGTGLTTVAVETVAAWSQGDRPESAVLLVPTRQRAAAMRVRLSRRLARTTGSVLVRTPASLAYAVLRLRSSLRAEPAPTLVTGPEQDGILAELIAGHLAGEGVEVQWPEHISGQVLALPAFRAELRDLLMRAAEAGIDGPELIELGRRHGRPHWCAAGLVLGEYNDVMALGETTPDRGPRFDAATIVDQAVVALAGWDAEFGAQNRPNWSLVLHDDYQDATLATGRLLSALSDGGARIAVLGDPDRAVQAFRGGQPTLLDAATHRAGSLQGAFGATAHVLATSHRHGPGLRAAITGLTRQLPLLGSSSRRSAQAAGPDPVPSHGTDPDLDTSPVRHLLLPSGPQEVAAVARELRIAHLRHRLPWSQMAVIVRSADKVGQVRRGLRTARIPLASAVPDRPLRTEPAVRPLLMALRAVIDGSVSAHVVTSLLLSPLGGLDSVSLRTLRRALRHQSGSDLSGDELLCRAVLDPGAAAVADLPSRLRRAPQLIAGVLAAGRSAFAAEPRNTELVLWQMWDAAGLARSWQQQALGGGAAADRADADLDAVLALFIAAEQYTDRTTGADPSGFLAHLETQDFAADTLAARGQSGHAVAVHTAASAAGQEWDLVVVCGIQEDTWPDLRIRDTLLGAAHLADIVTARETGIEPRRPSDLNESLRAARQAVLADELRSFVAACSRARRQLILTAVLDTDDRPSPFFETLLDDERHGLPAVTPAAEPMDLRGLVGQLRAALHGSNDRGRAALDLLQYLHSHGVPEADPATWRDQLPPSSTDPAFEPGQPVPVSPSTVERAVGCPLQWLLSSAGGKKPDTREQSVGNLIHEIAAAHPHGSVEHMHRELDRRWHELGLSESWVSREERIRAERMLRKLGQYLADHPGEVDVEAEFDVTIDGARLRGRIDRVEHTATGVRVVDLKTGSTVPSAAATARHAQLGSYQLAVMAGAMGQVQPDGGSLVYLGATGEGPKERHQPPLAGDDEPDWARKLVQETVTTLTSSQFAARRNPMCGYCQLRTSCPVQPDGARVEPS